MLRPNHTIHVWIHEKQVDHVLVFQSASFYSGCRNQKGRFNVVTRSEKKKTSNQKIRSFRGRAKDRRTHDGRTQSKKQNQRTESSLLKERKHKLVLPQLMSDRWRHGVAPSAAEERQAWTQRARVLGADRLQVPVSAGRSHSISREGATLQLLHLIIKHQKTLWFKLKDLAFFFGLLQEIKGLFDYRIVSMSNWSTTYVHFRLFKSLLC